MKRVDVEKFIELARPGLDGYQNDGKDKAEYARLGKMIGRALLEAIGQQGKVRWNPAGPAVGGDVVAHGTDIAIYLIPPLFYGEEPEFYCRRVDGLDDHHGYGNRRVPFRHLLGIENGEGQAVEFMRETLAGPKGTRY